MSEYEQVTEFIDEWVSPTIISIFVAINDDYKWKSIHFHVGIILYYNDQILQTLQKHSTKKLQVNKDICLSIINLIHRLVDMLEDRYTVLINDLIPYLNQVST